MSNIALVTTPKSDSTTRYISAWAVKTIEELKSKNLQFIVLAKERAISSVLDSMIQKHCPSLIFLNGHGGPDVVTGHNNQILVVAGKNEGVLKDMVTYALSCSSGQMLGPAAIKAGASAYIGYEEDFIFFISPDKMSRPLGDKTADMFLTPANHVIVSLAKGHTAGEATISARGYFLKSIQKLITSEATEDDQTYMRYLAWDMKSLICHGDKTAMVIK